MGRWYRIVCRVVRHDGRACGTCGKYVFHVRRALRLALYDSVLDRYSELFTLFGILYFLLLQGYFWGSIITGVAIIGSLMVSYVRARAEGLDLECKVGLMQRPERVVLTALGAIFCGVFQDCTAFDSVYILIAPLAIIAVLANWTAFVRINHCRKLLKK